MDHRILSSEEINSRISRLVDELEKLVRQYGSYNVIANAILRNSPVFHSSGKVSTDVNPIIQEYLSLLVLKFPYSIGLAGELTRNRNLLSDFRKIDILASEITSLHSLLNLRRFNIYDSNGNISDIENIAMQISSEELAVRNETFEEHHWERLEELYLPYNDYFKEKLGFTVDQAIDFCIAISDYTHKQLKKAIDEPRQYAKVMYDEVRAYKYRNKVPNNPYPLEYLELYKEMSDERLEAEFNENMMIYTVATVGSFLQFKVDNIVEMGDIDKAAFVKFLDQFSISFGQINVDLSTQDIMHPLKNRPILIHENLYFCSSLSLLDYALDRIFSDTLLKDEKKIKKYQLRRHEYLNDKGIEYLTKSLKSSKYYTNLKYPGGELDGLIFCDNNVLFIESKGHLISDRAKRGFVDRIKSHLKDVIEESHSQAIRTYNYLKDKPSAEFRSKNGKKLTIDGTKFKNAYFISLTLESFKAFSTSLPVNNSIGLFDENTFPWIVSLYDLRVVCEHMEGPSYLIHYLRRRRDFFSLSKYTVSDELTVLAYYLERNLNFDDNFTGYKNFRIQLDSKLERFNRYYLSQEGKFSKSVPIMKHFTKQPVKSLIAALEKSGLDNSIDAAALILEMASNTQTKLIDAIRKSRKKFNKDGSNHDFRIGEINENFEESWMLSYCLGFESKEFIDFFENRINSQFSTYPTKDFIAILDKGKKEFEVAKVLHLTFQLPKPDY